MAKAKVFGTPAFKTDTGVSSNHSSTVPSTDHTANTGHEQQDDALQDVAPPQDPNLSGMTPTESTYTWQAGSMSGWVENDDYREFFEPTIDPESRVYGRSLHDEDYDDNGGYPTAIGHSRGDFGPKFNPDATGGSAEQFTIGPIIMRRI